MYTQALIQLIAVSGALAMPASKVTRDIVCRNDIPGGLGCNPAHAGSCPPEYTANPTAYASAYAAKCSPTATAAAAAPPTATVTISASSITCRNDIPGGLGCNPARPGSCPDAYTANPNAYAAAYAAKCNPPAATAAVSAAAPSATSGTSGWTVEDLSRYCAADGTGCDYNFKISAPGGTSERCTVIRLPVPNAPTESWYNQPCTTGSKYTVSWGYAASPAPAFAVMTLVNTDTKETAFFGVPDVNGQFHGQQDSTFGSGQYGNIGPQKVYPAGSF